MRHVFPSSEVYHLWANETQDSARNSSSSVSFNGDTAYSYRAPIARIVRNEAGSRAFVVATRTWSVTTSGHQSALRSAIPYGARVFYVYDLAYGDGHPNDSHHNERITAWLKEVGEAELKAKRSRTDHTRSYQYERVQSLIAQIQNYCNFYSLPPVSINTEALAEDIAREAKAAREREARWRKNRREALAKDAVEWLAGRRCALSYEYPDVLLRVNGEDVETSRGARVPLKHAERLFRIWRNGEVKSGERVGVYSVSSVHGNALQIGCHYITRAEADRFAVSQGWIAADAAAA